MQEIPYGYCHCGCGQKTNLAKQSHTKRKQTIGEPLRFIGGHQCRGPIFEPGTRFGRYVVLSQRGRHITCVCDCGTVKKVYREYLMDGRVKSCGCLSRENSRARLYKHGNTAAGKTTPTYKVWRNMLERCNNLKNDSYTRYGARGINMCERWQSFENFLADMGEKPKGLSIERKDNDLGYSPENCRWATSTEQARNRCSNRWITHMGKNQLLVDWARELGIEQSTIARRIKRGMSVEQALRK